MEQLGKILVLGGLALALVGGVMWALAALGLRKLPGDIVCRWDGLTLVIPLATGLILSAMLTLALWLWRWLGQ